MKNRILLTAALCMSMMAQITAQGYTSLREQIQLAGEWRSSLGTCRLPGTTDENRLSERNPGYAGDVSVNTSLSL